MTREDWNLLVLSAADGRPLSPVQYQKCLFLLEKAYPHLVTANGWYEFQPYNYGVFDADVYADGEKMQHQGLTQITRTGGGWNEYAATPAGLARASALSSQVPHVAEYARQLVKWARGLSFADLVRAVYNRYPETRARSIFRD